MTEQTRGRMLRLGRALLGLLALYFLIVNVVMFAGIRFDELLAGVVLGTIAAEIALCAVFTALAPFSIFIRVITGLAGVVVVCLAVFRMGGASNEDHAIISVAAFLQWIAVQVPLWVFRVRSGWCLRITTDQTSEFRRGDLQFGIRQLMAWTTAVAVILSVVKTAVPEDAFSRSGDVARIIQIAVVLAVSSCLAAWPIIWAAFVRSAMFAWCVVAAACSAVLCCAELLTFETLIGPGADIEVFVALHLIQLIAVGGSLLLIRMNGVRLVRVGDHAAAGDRAIDTRGESHERGKPK